MINYKDKTIFPIGIGTWGLGGLAERDPNNDDTKQIDALVYMLSKGMNFFEVSLWAAESWSARLLAKAIKESGIKREGIIITEAIYEHNNETLESAEEERKKFLEIFEIDYLDSLQFNHGGVLKYGEETLLKYLDQQLEDGTTKFVSMTNAPLDFLKKFHNHFGEKLFAHEVGFNFEIRENVENGIIEYTTKSDLLNVVYQPLRRNRTANRNWSLLLELSKKYEVTQNQILLSWMVSKGFLPLVKSETIAHIDENLASIDLKLSEADIKKLDGFRPPNYASPNIDWLRTGEGIRIDQLSNVFDEEYDMQNS